MGLSVEGMDFGMAAGVRFHHVGYAVKDIRAYVSTFLMPLFSPVRISDLISDPIQRVTVCFAEMPGGMAIELVEPVGGGQSRQGDDWQ